jgi:hypothetical protein
MAFDTATVAVRYPTWERSQKPNTGRDDDEPERPCNGAGLRAAVNGVARRASGKILGFPIGSYAMAGAVRI